MGITKQTISLWERGPRKPEFETLDRLADFFEVSLGYLLGTSDDDTPVSEPDDRDAVALASAEEVELLNNLAKQLVRLSPDSRAIVAGAIEAAFRHDRERDLLGRVDDYEVLIRSKLLDEDVE